MNLLGLTFILYYNYNYHMELVTHKLRMKSSLVGIHLILEKYGFLNSRKNPSEISKMSGSNRKQKLRVTKNSKILAKINLFYTIRVNLSGTLAGTIDRGAKTFFSKKIRGRKLFFEKKLVGRRLFFAKN